MSRCVLSRPGHGRVQNDRTDWRCRPNLRARRLYSLTSSSAAAATGASAADTAGEVHHQPDDGQNIGWLARRNDTLVFGQQPAWQATVVLIISPGGIGAVAEIGLAPRA